MINIGRIPPDAMQLVYQRADILLFPTAREGFGLATAEAMACGLPVVASNNSALPELIENGKGGYLCETGNIEAYAEGISRLASNGESRRIMGQHTREQAVNRFSQGRMTQGHVRLFGSLAP